MTVLPPTTTSSERLPVNVSPALFLPESSAVDRTTFSCVPAGMVTVFGAAGLGASALGLSAAADSAAAGALDSAVASSGVAVSVSDLAQAPATARINSRGKTFQMRMIDTLLDWVVNIHGSTSNIGSRLQKELPGCYRWV